MPNWVVKSAVHRVISWLPNRQFWNGLLQTWITRSTRLDLRTFEGRLRECSRFLAAFRDSNPSVTGFRVLEIGTGWYPTIPVGLYLCGAGEVRTMDIDPLLNRERLKVMIGLYSDLERGGRLVEFLPERSSERIRALEGLLDKADGAKVTELLRELNIHAAVGDARRTGLADGSVDFFFSSGVLEYVPVPALRGILSEARRVASPRFVTAHRLNLVDQFAYFDQSITPFNFLKFSPRQWRWANSPLIWQNRLRISDFRKLFRDSGFEITREENTPGSPAELAKVALAPEFRAYAKEDLLVLHSFFTARLTSSNRGAGPSAPGGRAGQ